MITTKVNGLSELAALLRSLPADIASKNGGPLSRALAKQARKVRDVAKAKAPVRSGRLRRSIVAKRDRDPESRGRTEAYLIYPRRGKKRNDPNGAYYAHMIEFGTVRQPAQPFMRPAFAETQTPAGAEFAEDLQKAIERAVRAKAKRVARG